MREPADGRTSGLGHETRDVRFRPLMYTGVAITLLVGVTLVVVYVLFRVFSHAAATQGSSHPFAESRQVTNSPRLQVDPPRQKLELRQREDEWLNSYGWADQKAGLARIPIDRAIAVLADRGLPARAQAQP